MPPLRERKEDIYALVRYFLTAAGAPERELTFLFMLAVCHYSWPYNVRELAAAVKRAVTVAVGRPLDASDLPDAVIEHMAEYGETSRITRRESTSPVSASPASVRPSPEDLSERLRMHGGNVAAVARELGKDRTQVHR